MSRVHRYLAAILVATTFVAFPAASFAGVFVGIGIGGGGLGLSINVAPPPLPVYEQPPCEVADTIWTPGYWAYGPEGYYWVPGTWVEAPQIGYLWTPGYWGYGDGAYAWHAGYWGPHVGFYGGVNYGYGYGGDGYGGGGWYGRHFRYNTAYTHVNRTVINNVYIDRTVVNNYYGARNERTSYDGGENGLRSRPTAHEIAYRNEQHLPPTPVQRRYIESAAQNRNFLNSVNHGRPNTAVDSPLTRRTTTDPFSRFDRNAPSYANGTTGERNEPSRFDRSSRAYGRGATRPASEPSRYGRERSPSTDPFSRFDRNTTTGAHDPDTYPRRAGSEYSRASNRSARSYGEPRNVDTYHPQASNRSERSYGAAPNRYHAEPTYRSHAAPAMERPSERSRPAEHGEPHRNESNHRDH